MVLLFEKVLTDNLKTNGLGPKKSGLVSRNWPGEKFFTPHA